VRLSVRDDGRGAAVIGDGFGLIGIRERAEQLGGTVSVRSAPAAGFALDLELRA
jgi:signal transduction histidine kinase